MRSYETRPALPCLTAGRGGQRGDASIVGAGVATDERFFGETRSLFPSLLDPMGLSVYESSR